MGKILSIINQSKLDCVLTLQILFIIFIIFCWFSVFFFVHWLFVWGWHKSTNDLPCDFVVVVVLVGLGFDIFFIWIVLYLISTVLMVVITLMMMMMMMRVIVNGSRTCLWVTIYYPNTTWLFFFLSCSWGHYLNLQWKKIFVLCFSWLLKHFELYWPKTKLAKLNDDN